MNDYKLLVEEALDSDKFAPLTESERNTMSLILNNALTEIEKTINENTMTADVEQFTPIIPPLVRRVYPKLIANYVLGIQPMSMPTGFLYALVNQYTGDGVLNANSNDLKIVKSADDLSAVAKYFEGDLYLVLKSEDLSAYTIDAEYSNEAAFGIIFKNYSGSYATGVMEKMGKEIRELGFSIARKSIEARSRALKGQYTIEMYQDLKSQHGVQADAELMSLISYELQAEIDRECVDFVNTTAQQLPDTAFTNTPDNSGRFEIEKYRREAVRISKEAALIGIDTKRGQGNILLISQKVSTMLEQIGQYKIVTSDVSRFDHNTVGGEVGTFDGRFKVIVDQYAKSDYITVLYKGADRRDAMGFFAPYVPLHFIPTTNPDSGQKAIIAKTRYAITTIPGVKDPNSNDRASMYARSFGINFENTVLA